MRAACLLLAILALAAVATVGAEPERRTANCERASTGLVPLTELGTRKYHGYSGGLYPGGRSAPSVRYAARGKSYLAQVKPRGPTGAAAADGKIVLLSVGMSNTTQEFSVFRQRVAALPQRNPRLVIVDGAQGGQDAERVKDPAASFWRVVDERLRAAGVTGAQVQVAWVKEAIAGESRPFPGDARGLQASLRAIVQLMRDRFPNLRLVFLSSRIYAGYATTSLNPEPYAYQSGFAVKWLIQERIEHRLKGPWLGWGPYLWADGTNASAGGPEWQCADFMQDGTHPSPSGRQKVAQLLLDFFSRDPRARSWFLAS